MGQTNPQNKPLFGPGTTKANFGHKEFFSFL